jgi:hypothetical protein
MTAARFISILLCLLIAAVARTSAQTETKTTDSATSFINTRENVWFKYKSPAIQEAYPFGRSNAAHNAELDKIFDFNKVSKDSDLRNKHYLAEDDWYAVEWNYSATDVVTGRKQKESSLCLAQIKDQKIVQWIEYFDDTVGELQMAGKLPLPPATEAPNPWPLDAKMTRTYRP